MSTTTRSKRVPITRENVILHVPPIAPCEMLPTGLSGLVQIGNTQYDILHIAHLPPRGESVVRGFRLLNLDNEKVYDIDTSQARYVCDCPDHEVRGGTLANGCKHCQAIRILLEDKRI
jgi:hypothetical protein